MLYSNLLSGVQKYVISHLSPAYYTTRSLPFLMITFDLLRIRIVNVLIIQLSQSLVFSSILCADIL